MFDNQIKNKETDIADFPFFEYNQRQKFELSADRIRERALDVKPSGNFIYNRQMWQPNEYEGFAIISMLNENEENESLTKRLVEIQKELQYNLTPTYGFYNLPAESFHQTIANTLSADRFKNNILNKGLEAKYPDLINEAFNSLELEAFDYSIGMKILGLSVFGTAIGALGIFENEEEYSRIINFRKGFYSNPQLNELDIKMTRPFIGHITLTYIEQSLNKNQKDQLAIVLNEINETLENERNYFNINTTGLRRYHHLSEFKKEINYPTIAI